MTHIIGNVDASASKLRRVGRAYLWSILLWVGFAPVVAIQSKVLKEGGQHVAFWNLLLIEGSWSLTAALLTPPIFYIVRQYPIAKRGEIKRLAGYLACVVPYVIVTTVIRWIMLPPWDAAAQRFMPHSAHSLLTLFGLFANQIWAYIATLIAAHAYGYFRRTQAQELERAQLQQALAASELQSLKSQLHPHFLFNTMQGISRLIEGDPRRAKAIVLKLSDLLRTALEHGNFDLISLSEELKFVENYLELQKMRLEDRLCVRWDVAPETRQMLVPQLILQPLVENAIVHGIANCREGGWIQIGATRTESVMELTVKNSVGGRASNGMGLGLQNTRARLKHLYGDEAKLSFELCPDRVAIATLIFPGLTSQQADAVRSEPQQRSV